MERKDFIEQVGLSGAAILIFGCMQSCSKSDGPGTNTNTGGGQICSTKAISPTYVWPALPVGGGWTYGTVINPSTNNFIYTATGAGDGSTITCTETGCR